MEKQRKPGNRISMTLLTALGVWALGLAAAAQEQKVTLSSREITIEQAFEQIERQTGLVVAINHTVFNTDRRVTLPSASGTAKEIMTNLLAGTGQTFEHSGNYVILRPESQPGSQTTQYIYVAARSQPTQPGGSGTPESLAAPSPVRADNAGTLPAPAPRAGWQWIPAITGGPQPRGFTKQRLPLLAIKTNLLDDATTSINLGFEMRLSDRWTIHLPVSYNPWKFSENRQWRHLSFAPEGRYWLGESFNGHFFGFHGLYSYFNAGNIDLPLGIWPDLKEYRYEGNLYGAGVAYGYQWIWGKRWGLEATLGMGYFYADYKQYDCANCGQQTGKGYKHYFGPTKTGVSLIFFIK